MEPKTNMNTKLMYMPLSFFCQIRSRINITAIAINR